MTPRHHRSRIDDILSRFDASKGVGLDPVCPSLAQVRQDVLERVDRRFVGSRSGVDGEPSRDRVSLEPLQHAGDREAGLLVYAVVVLQQPRLAPSLKALCGLREASLSPVHATAAQLKRGLAGGAAHEQPLVEGAGEVGREHGGFDVPLQIA